MYNLVIIGGGAAGLIAAWTAHEQGIQNIAILESLKHTGGNSAMAGGMIYAVGTHYLEGSGLNDEVSELRESLYFHHYDLVEPKLLRSWIDETKNTIQWLEERGYGIKLCELGEGYTHILADSPGVSWFHKVLRPLAADLTKQGVSILTSTTAKQIETNGQNAVCGVIAESVDGETIRLETRSVLLACGGFMSNTELLKKYFPMYYTEDSFYHIVPSPGNGIDLAKSAGALVNQECTLVKESGMCFKPGPFAPGRIFAMDGSVFVNRLGQRFVDESLWNRNYSANALLRQPGKEAFAIYSKETLEQVMNAELPFNFRENRTVYLDYIAKSAQEGIECVYCDTLDQLADWIGADPAVLKNTVESYNQFCQTGVDLELAKPANYLFPLLSGPYLAVRIKPMYIDTIGPVVVDGQLHVLNEARKPIPGFYAAGVIAAGWQGRDYMRFGSALSFSTTSGRMAGASIAQDLLEQFR